MNFGDDEIFPTTDGQPAGGRGRRARWLIGWVLIPLLAMATLVGIGTHLGANNPNAWYTRAVRYVIGP